MGIQVPPSGPTSARIMLVGEAPGYEEEQRGEPFVGASGAELNRMLQEVGIARNTCFVTNVCKERPPRNDMKYWIRRPTRFTSKPTKEDEWRRAAGIEPRTFVPVGGMLVDPRVAAGRDMLQKEISLVQPNLIITFGNTPLWALTGKTGITKWRGSMLRTESGIRLIPTYHPAAILRQWDWRAIGVADLRRAGRYADGVDYPARELHFLIRPSFPQVTHTLGQLLARADSGLCRLSFDIETRAGHIACAGISWDYSHALCIPFMCRERREGYWDLDEETHIVGLLHRVLTHPNVRVVGQNILYDSQYTYRWWHFVPRVEQDTMISQHTLYADLPKSLAFQASMYCEHYVFWKDEGKDWEKNMREEELWHYNCLDCIYTDEVGQVEKGAVQTMELDAVHQFQQAMFWPVLQAMQIGVRVDVERRGQMILEVQEEIARRHAFIQHILGHPLNPGSSKQMHALFYTDFGLPVQKKRGKPGEPMKPTLDDDALMKLARLEPLMRPLVNAIADIRTLEKFLSNFLTRSLDIDGRMRCAFNIGGSAGGKSAPVTYRMSSSENAFGSGTNLQTIPSEHSRSVNKARARAALGAGIGDPYEFPNIREIFIPDPLHTWFDLDLQRADLFVVAYEADDEQLISAMHLGVDIHLLNAFVLEGRTPPHLEELVEREDGPYKSHRGALKGVREFAKTFCHGTNYGGGAPTMAAGTGRTIREIERAQAIWFEAHPGIKKWHERVKEQVLTHHRVENKFGYRWQIFDRVESIIPEAIAWIPQSTVSIVINRIWEKIYRELPEVQILLQVHDSLAGQFKTMDRDRLLPRIRELSRVVVPYPNPLIIPVSIKTSEKSWGAC